MSTLYWSQIMQIQRGLSAMKDIFEKDKEVACALAEVYNLLLDYRHECIKQISNDPVINKHDLKGELVKEFISPVSSNDTT